MKVYTGPYPGMRSKKERRVSIVIHDYDTWNFCDHLAKIILPVLRKIREEKQGSPHVDDEDVPVERRRSSAPPVENEWDADEFFFKRWEWVLDEIIWAFATLYEDEDEGRKYYYDPYAPDETIEPRSFSVIQDDGSIVEERFLDEESLREIGKFNRERYKVFSDRVDHAFLLFGKYYRSLWT